jgi:PPM family protein phosphatase
MMEKIDLLVRSESTAASETSLAVWPTSTRAQSNSGSAVASAWVSNTGLVRAHNEDNCFANDELGLYVLADGMGGYNAGEVASKLAVDELRLRVPERYMPTTDASTKESLLIDAVQLANKAILKTAKTRPECLGMGTTLVAVLMGSKLNASIAHIGDSRAYFYARNVGRLSQLTKDHSVGQELIDRGSIKQADLIRFPMRGVLTRALGVEPDIAVDTMSINLAEGDALMLCSDGLSDMLSFDDIQGVFEHHFQTKPTNSHMGSHIADELVCLALKRGGTDNVSAMVIVTGLTAITAQFVATNPSEA